MPRLSIDVPKLRQASKGFLPEVQRALGLGPDAVRRKFAGDTKFHLEDLNKVCEVIERHPRDFLKETNA